MLYAVLYDISKNSIRNKIIRKCKNYGLTRIQKSIFMGEITKNKAESLSLELNEFSLSEEDKIFVVPIYESFLDSSLIRGKIDKEKLKDKDFIIIK